MLSFLQIEGETLHHQKDYDSLSHTPVLYCTGLELNLRYLQGMPVPGFVDLTWNSTDVVLYKNKGHSHKRRILCMTLFLRRRANLMKMGINRVDMTALTSEQASPKEVQGC